MDEGRTATKLAEPSSKDGIIECYAGSCHDFCFYFCLNNERIEIEWLAANPLGSWL
jgi:hypothetical protein